MKGQKSVLVDSNGVREQKSVAVDSKLERGRRSVPVDSKGVKGRKSVEVDSKGVRRHKCVESIALNLGVVPCTGGDEARLKGNNLGSVKQKPGRILPRTSKAARNVSNISIDNE